MDAVTFKKQGLTSRERTDPPVQPIYLAASASLAHASTQLSLFHAISLNSKTDIDSVNSVLGL